MTEATTPSYNTPSYNTPSHNEVPAYKNPELTTEERINDLLSRMTLEEKVGQMMQLDSRGADL